MKKLVYFIAPIALLTMAAGLVSPPLSSVNGLSNGVKALNSGQFSVSADGTATITNCPTSAIHWATNGQISTTEILVAAGGTYAITNSMAGNMTLSTVGGTDPSEDRWGVLLLKPSGGDRTLTLPANWNVIGGTRTITVTNGIVGVLSVNTFGTVVTNATYQAYY